MNKYIYPILIICGIMLIYEVTSSYYINKYENIITQNNIIQVEKENSIRKDMANKLKEASDKVSDYERKYNEELSKIDKDFDSNNIFIFDNSLFNEDRTQTNSSNICNFTNGACSATETTTRIILSKTDVRDTLSLAREADRTLNELNLCKGFIRTIYDSNKNNES